MNKKMMMSMAVVASLFTIGSSVALADDSNSGFPAQCSSILSASLNGNASAIYGTNLSAVNMCLNQCDEYIPSDAPKDPSPEQLATYISECRDGLSSVEFNANYKMTLSGSPYQLSATDFSSPMPSAPKMQSSAPSQQQNNFSDNGPSTPTFTESTPPAVKSTPAPQTESQAPEYYPPAATYTAPSNAESAPAPKPDAPVGAKKTSPIHWF